MGWRTRPGPGLGESVGEVVSVLVARERVNDGRRDGRRGMGQQAGPGEERLGSSWRQMGGLGEGLKVKRRAQVPTGGFCARFPAGGVVFAGCQEIWAALRRELNLRRGLLLESGRWRAHGGTLCHPRW